MPLRLGAELLQNGPRVLVGYAGHGYVDCAVDPVRVQLDEDHGQVAGPPRAVHGAYLGQYVEPVDEVKTRAHVLVLQAFQDLRALRAQLWFVA